MDICLYVCIYVCISVCGMHVCMHACMCACKKLCNSLNSSIWCSGTTKTATCVAMGLQAIRYIDNRYNIDLVLN